MKKILDFFAVLFLSVMFIFSTIGCLSALGAVIVKFIKIDDFDISIGFGMKLFFMLNTILSFLILPAEDISEPSSKGDILALGAALCMMFLLFILLLVISCFPAKKFYKELCNIIKNKTKPSLFFQIILFILLFYTGFVFIQAIYFLLNNLLEGIFFSIYYIPWIFDFIIFAVLFYKLREKFLSKKNIFFQSLVAILLFAIIIPVFMLSIFLFPFAHAGFIVDLFINEFLYILYISYTLLFIPIFMLINKKLKGYTNGNNCQTTNWV